MTFPPLSARRQAISQSHSSRAIIAKAFPIFVSILALPMVVLAGDGKFHDGEFDFSVSVRFEATEAQLETIATAFEHASQVLADATDEQNRLGTVTIVNSGGAPDAAEYWVHAGKGRAYATMGKYGQRGEHVNLFFDDDFDGKPGGPDADAYTIAHEHAHHAYAVLDEYSGIGAPQSCVESPCQLGMCTEHDVCIADADCAARESGVPDNPSLSFCLMDNFFLRGGRATGVSYTLNEFCKSANHDPDMDTFQQTSCWEVLGASPYQLQPPGAQPEDLPPPPHTVDFETGQSGLSAMLLLDRSSSMNDEQRLAFAKRGAAQYVSFLRIGDGLGLASFANAGTVDFPLTPIPIGNEQATKAAAKDAIDALSAAGSTNIGGGLLAALDELVTRPERPVDEVIVLLSDGDHNTGTAPGAILPALIAEGITVFTIGVGANLTTDGEKVLRDIADKTGGRYSRISNSFELVALFLRLVFEGIGDALVTRAPETLSSQESMELAVLLETGVEEVTFAVALADSMDEFSLTLRTPSGTMINEANAISNDNVHFIADPNSLAFQIAQPEAGTWTVVVSTDLIRTGSFEALAFAKHEGVNLAASPKTALVVYPAPAIINASPMFHGQRVVGANVQGTVVRPDGTEVPVVLHDDGHAEHDDIIPEDGIYSARFAAYTVSGTYTFNLTATNDTGVVFAGEELFSLFTPPNSAPVPQFTRMGTTTVVVTDVPTGTEICGGIFDDTTWSPSGNPYRVTCDTVVFQDRVLVIEPGVIVEFAPGSGLEIRGSLRALGVPGEPIVFTSATPPELWDGVSVAGGENAALISHAELSFARTAVSSGATDSGFVTKIMNSVFRNNNVGVSGAFSFFGRSVGVKGSRFEDNGAGLSGGSLAVCNSFLVGNDYGFRASGGIFNSLLETNGVALEMNGAVANCRISANNYGIRQSSSGVFGLSLSGNTITGNTLGLFVSDASLLLGFDSIERNNLFGNGINAQVSRGNNWQMPNNWWGTTNTATINQGIRDGRDDVALGLVEYLPVLAGPVPECDVPSEEDCDHDGVGDCPIAYDGFPTPTPSDASPTPTSTRTPCDTPLICVDSLPQETVADQIIIEGVVGPGWEVSVRRGLSDGGFESGHCSDVVRELDGRFSSLCLLEPGRLNTFIVAVRRTGCTMYGQTDDCEGEVLEVLQVASTATPTATASATETATTTSTSTATPSRSPTASATAAASATSSFSPTVRAACPGDCDGNRRIDVRELVVGVRIALGRSVLSTCSEFDVNRDGVVMVNELIRAVTAALRGCGNEMLANVADRSGPRGKQLGESTILGRLFGGGEAAAPAAEVLRSGPWPSESKPLFLPSELKPPM